MIDEGNDRTLDLHSFGEARKKRKSKGLSRDD